VLPRGDLVGVELDMDHGTIEFSVNGRTIGPVTGVPDSGSGLVMHVAVCMFRAGDSVEATAGGRDYMLANAELVRKGKPVGFEPSPLLLCKPGTAHSNSWLNIDRLYSSFESWPLI
jgi:hypothetical protein